MVFLFCLNMQRMKNWMVICFMVCLSPFISCGHIQEPQFKEVQNFKLKGIGLQKADFSLGVQFYNPNNFAVKIKEAAVDYYIDSIYVGKFVQDEEVEVSKKNNFTIPISGSIPILTALKLNLTDLKDREVSIKADGSVKVGKGGVYINKPFHYSGKHKLNMKL